MEKTCWKRLERQRSEPCWGPAKRASCWGDCRRCGGGEFAGAKQTWKEVIIGDRPEVAIKREVALVGSANDSTATTVGVLLNGN